MTVWEQPGFFSNSLGIYYKNIHLSALSKPGPGRTESGRVPRDRPGLHHASNTRPIETALSLFQIPAWRR